jgi:ATP-binding cassette subfamily C protein CydC
VNPVIRIIGLWRGQTGWLAFGAVLSLGALAAGLALMGGAGNSVALALAGAAIVVPAVLQVAGVARVCLRYLERVFTHEATFRALADLRLYLFRGLARGAAGGLGYRRSGDALARLVNDVDTLDGLYLRIAVPLLGAVLVLPVLAVLLYRASPWALLALVPYAAVAFALPLAAAAAARETGAAAGLAMAGLRNAALDAISGLREIKIFGAEGRMLAAVQAREAELLAAQRGLNRRISAFNAAGFLVGQAAVLLTILIGLVSPPAAALIAVFVLIMAFETAQGLPRAGALFGQVQAAAARVVQAAEAAPPVAAPAQAAPMPAGTAIAFSHVSFRYAPEVPLFENLSLQVPAGSRVAILGASGAGKSTIAALLLKLIAPSGGEIRLGATDLAALPAEAVRARIAYLSQTTHLFADTIANNLRLADPGATDEQLWSALEAAQIAETIRSLPDGLDTWLGESGDSLSGGQGRRLALARTLLSRAPILILDEPCAGLDAETEMAFYRTLNGAIDGRSLILIAHRLTGVERIDRVWRLTSGTLVPATA